MARPMRTPTCRSLTVDGAARCRSRVHAHVLQDVLPIGWTPHGVACNHVVGSASSNHHARLLIAASRLRIHHVANTLRHAPECHSVKGDAASQFSPKPLDFLCAKKTVKASTMICTPRIMMGMHDKSLGEILE